MRRILTILAMAISIPLVGCGSEDSAQDKGKDKASDKGGGGGGKVYQVGEEAPAGKIVDNVTGVETMDTIGAERSIRAPNGSELPAGEGQTWVHVSGEIRNDSGDDTSGKPEGFLLYDSSGAKYEFASDGVNYSKADTHPAGLDVKKAATTPFEAWYQVPMTAKGFQLEGSDLNFVPEKKVRIDLGK